MTLTTISAIDCPISTLVETANRAFSNYIAGTVQFTNSSIASMIARDGIDLNWSQVGYHHDQIIGFALIARRGDTSRLGAFGIVPDAQGKGWGKHFMTQLIRQSRDRGDQRMTLEVFEQNTAAVRLYQSLGFRSLWRLMGYEGQELTGKGDALEPISIPHVARCVSAWGTVDLPWQCSGETLIHFSPPYAAYALGESGVLISDPGAEQIIIRAIAVPIGQQQQGIGTRLIAALIAAFPEKKWYVPQICPEAFGGLFTRNGLTALPLNQLQMEMRL